jgi:hypothetical protein
LEKKNFGPSGIELGGAHQLNSFILCLKVAIEQDILSCRSTFPNPVPGNPPPDVS